VPNLIISPRPAAGDEVMPLAPRLPSLRGAYVGLRIQWINYEQFASRIEQRLLDSQVLEGTKRWEWMLEKRILAYYSPEAAASRQKEFDEFAAGLDAAIVGLAA
jgi:hypothetical protein